MRVQAYAAHEAGGKLEPFEYELGSLKPYEVEIDVEYCGICHSDLSMLKNERGLTQYPFVPGHEVIGRVSAIGNMVSVSPLISSEKSIGGSPIEGPAEILKMLDFCNRHSLEPIIEEFPFSRVNEALAHLESGKARYGIVLRNDFN